MHEPLGHSPSLWQDVAACLSQKWWAGASGIVGIVAMGIALATVFYSIRGMRTADSQSKAYLQQLRSQTAAISQALMRPEIRAVTSEHAREAVHRISHKLREQLPPSSKLKPNVWIAVMNIGLAVARDIEFRCDVTTTIYGDLRVLPAQNDFQVLGFALDPSTCNMDEGFLEFRIKYSDLMGTRYSYWCKLRYAGSFASVAEDSTTQLLEDV